MMATPLEQALTFECRSERLLGILHHGSPEADIGVVIVVGGPQYRVGSHRQFVLLARALASAGYPTLRFDYRGMGDSAGCMRNFENVNDDISAAIGALEIQRSSVRRVVLWGLCDGASAVLLYCDQTNDRRVAGVCLANPWVRSEKSLAQTQLKHYYVQRLTQPQFWEKLVRGKVGLSAAAELVQKWRLAWQSHTPSSTKSVTHDPFQSCMARAFTQLQGRVLLLLSENDYTAKEFIEYSRTDAAWRSCELPSQIIAGADHTFSETHARVNVEDATVHWIRTRLCGIASFNGNTRANSTPEPAPLLNPERC